MFHDKMLEESICCILASNIVADDNYLSVSLITSYLRYVTCAIRETDLWCNSSR